MLLKFVILALAVVAITAAPQGDRTACRSGETLVEGTCYGEFPLDGNCEAGQTYHHFGYLCKCLAPLSVDCKKIKKD